MSVIPTVPVTVHYQDAQGQGIAGATVTALLTTAERYQGLEVPAQAVGETDAQGKVVLQLFPNDLGTAGSAYSLAASDPSSGTVVRFVAIPNAACDVVLGRHVVTAVTGPQGVPGPKGERGEQGAKGDPGDPAPNDHTLLTNIGANTHAQLDAHLDSTDNPHGTTAAQIGAAPTSHAATGTTYGAASETNYGHVQLGTASPAALGAAAKGTGTRAAHEDHVHPTTGLMTTGHAANGITGFGPEPGSVGSSTSGKAGTATTVARGDHSHDLGTHAHTGPTDGGPVDHGGLTGLGDDDHPQYALKTYVDGLFSPTLSAQNGECKLSLSGGSLLLSRYNGYRLIIDNAQQVIPAAGVTLAATGLAASTTYYIYAAMVSGQMTLEASTTGYAQDARNGVSVKNGDASRTLVGMARTTSGTAWADTATQRLVISWYKRQKKWCSTTFPQLSTGSGSAVELSSSYRLEFLSFDTWVAAWFAALGQNSGSFDFVGFLGLDGAVQYDTAVSINSPNNLLTYEICSSPRPIHVTAGYHYISMFGRATYGGTSYYTGFIACEVWG